MFPIKPQNPGTQILILIVSDNYAISFNSSNFVMYTSDSKMGTGESRLCFIMNGTMLVNNGYNYNICCQCLNACMYVVLRNFPGNVDTICDIKYYIFA